MVARCLLQMDLQEPFKLAIASEVGYPRVRLIVVDDQLQYQMKRARDPAQHVALFAVMVSAHGPREGIEGAWVIPYRGQGKEFMRKDEISCIQLRQLRTQLLTAKGSTVVSCVAV